MKKLLIGLLALGSISAMANTYNCKLETANMLTDSNNEEKISIHTDLIEGEGQKLIQSTSSSFRNSGASVELKTHTSGRFEGFTSAIVYFHINISKMNGKPQKSGDYAIFTSVPSGSKNISATTYVDRKFVQIDCSRI